MFFIIYTYLFVVVALCLPKSIYILYTYFIYIVSITVYKHPVNSVRDFSGFIRIDNQSGFN